MGIVRKLLSAILSDRLSEASERHRLLTKAQAGFRRKEVCATQVACLLDMATRRKVCKKRTLSHFR